MINYCRKNTNFSDLLNIFPEYGKKSIEILVCLWEDGAEKSLYEKVDWNLVEINMKAEKKSEFAVKIHKIAIVFCVTVWYNKTAERKGENNSGTNRKYSKRW